MSRIQALLDMIKLNTSIHTIHLRDRYSAHEVLGSLMPYLRTKRLGPCVRAIQTTLPIAYRAKILGRALLAARTDANSFWMLLLSGNPEISFQPTTAATTPASSLYACYGTASAALLQMLLPTDAAAAAVTDTRSASTTGTSAAAS
jgi:hypothetical protein